MKDKVAFVTGAASGISKEIAIVYEPSGVISYCYLAGDGCL